LAIWKMEGSCLDSASAARSTWTCWANCAVLDLPAPKKPLPQWSARRLGDCHRSSAGGLLERFGLQSRAVELPEAPGEGNARLSPADLHQPQSFREASKEEGLISCECREHPASAAGGKADLDAPTTELIQRADTFGEVDRIVQGADEDGASQQQSLCASRGEGHEFERSQSRCGAKHCFLVQAL
jgi:hypothetical protein